MTVFRKSNLRWPVMVFLLLLGMTIPTAAEKLDSFSLRFGDYGVISLKYNQDIYDTEYIASGETLGHIDIRYRMATSEDWKQFSTEDVPRDRRRILISQESEKPHFLNVLNPSGWDDYFADLEIQERFIVEDGALYWTLHFRNLTHKPLELGDIRLPLPMNKEARWDKKIMYTQRVTQHRFVSGHGSFLFWMRPNGEGPFLVMTPVQECPLFESNRNERNFRAAKLEYFDRRGVYIHSRAAGMEAEAEGGNWRQEHTSARLSQKYSPNDELTYIFKFEWAEDYDEVRDTLYRNGLFDVRAVPGMTIPVDLSARLALRTRNQDFRIEPEFPEKTEIELLEEKADSSWIYRLRFTRLGENKLTLSWGDKHYMILEFFVTEPLETLIKKRASFLVEKQQHRRPDKWYDGVFSEWDMQTEELLGPDNTGGLRRYVLTCDDPGLCKAPYIAGKNVHYPDSEEVAAVEYYIRNFLWGGLQCTDKELYPYAVYGIPDWKINREAGPLEREGWTGHVWRLFDYPHVIHLYLNMHRVAAYYPELTSYLDADGYLERAYGTILAYFSFPEQLADWPAADLGNMDEVVIPEVIKTLYARGWREKADRARALWESKVEHFINDRPNLFHSEFPFDPTGFESYQAFARYAASELAQPQATMDVRAEAVDEFMQESIRLNIATRGWLETAYYLLGSERNLRYMSQMGGWAIFDYGLYFAENPFPYLQLGYASFLSSWALMNTGPREANYGFWYPGEANDGCAGSAFNMSAWGTTWLGKSIPRGPWAHSAEIDLGYGAALRTAAAVLAEDPLFGWFVYGGEGEATGSGFRIEPRDGLRQRFHIIKQNERLHLVLNRDGFVKNETVFVSRDFEHIRFQLENRGPAGHETELFIRGLPAGLYQVTIDGRKAAEFTSPGKIQLLLPVGEAPRYRVEISIRAFSE